MDFRLQPGQKGTYARRMHGLERMTAAISQHLSYGHVFGGIHVKFKAKNLLDSVLLNSARNAWIRTRFVLPWVACRSLPVSDTEKDAWTFTYGRSCNFHDVTQWSNETFNWSSSVCTLDEWEEKLKTAYWKPGDGRYGAELHLARAPSSGYFLMISIGHWLADGRAGLTALDIFLVNLRHELLGITEPPTSLAWGEEIARLPSSNVQAITVTGNGRISSSSILHKSPLAPPEANQQADVTPFTYPLVKQIQREDLPSLQNTIQLNQEETNAFTTACKHYKASISAVLISIHILADIETALYSAGQDETSFQNLIKHFKTADVYRIGNHAADRRALLPPLTFPSALGPGVFGNVVLEIFATSNDMNNIRRCISVLEDNRKITTILDESNFWNGMVPDTMHQLKSNTAMGATPEGFATIENLVDGAVSEFDFSTFSVPGISFTSIGRLSSLGLFNGFTPSRAHDDPNSPFFVEDMALGIRATGPSITTKVVMVWEYDGKLNIHLLGSPQWHRLETWWYFERSVRRMLRQIIEGNPTVACARL